MRILDLDSYYVFRTWFPSTLSKSKAQLLMYTILIKADYFMIEQIFLVSFLRFKNRLEVCGPPSLYSIQIAKLMI